MDTLHGRKTSAFKLDLNEKVNLKIYQKAMVKERFRKMTIPIYFLKENLSFGFLLNGSNHAIAISEVYIPHETNL